jgi:phospholipase C
MPDPILPQVKNIVFLMLENRSFDDLLGWLYKDSVPGYFYPNNPPKQPPPYDGLVEGKFFNPDSNGNNFDVIPLPDAAWQSGSPVPFYDPYEALRAYPVDIRAPKHSWYGVMNQFFGNQQVIPGLPSSNSGPPAMKGFLQDYGNVHDILWTYTPRQAKVINLLARQYAVSDRWFCSVPSDTSPNRAYSICGTSLGRESNLNLIEAEPPFTGAKTIFNWLAGAKKPKSWGLYYDDKYYNGKSYTQRLFPEIPAGGEIADFARFKTRAANDGLPAFSYLEPTKWTTPGIGSYPATDGTDYHPNAHIFPGENFLYEVYTAITSGPQWKRNETLFIVTFDEHGGTYDHVAPGSTVNPDGMNGRENGFKFDSLGARVSTILISPFVRPGTVFRAPYGSQYDFDHTSFIATILKWAEVPLTVAGAQSKRVLVAPTFEGVFADRIVNAETVKLEPVDLPLMAAAAASRVHPAGSAKELSDLLEGVPVVARRFILSRSKSLDDVQTEVARYRQDPEKFEAQINK